MPNYDGYWEMYEGGPYDQHPEEIYKCTDCGATTRPEEGHNGAPEPVRCASGCKNRESDWRPGYITEAYRRNFDRIFRKPPVGAKPN